MTALRALLLLHNWSAVLDPPLPSSVSGLVSSLAVVFIPTWGERGGGGDKARSTTQTSPVTYGKSVIILHNRTLHHSLCCATIGMEGVKVCMKPIRDCEVQAHSATSHQKPVTAWINFWYPTW